MCNLEKGIRAIANDLLEKAEDLKLAADLTSDDEQRAFNKGVAQGMRRGAKALGEFCDELFDRPG